jgi:DNA-binding CsgD family transcriptional regulator
MDLLEIVKKRSVPGVLILDDHKKPVYLNPIAFDILRSLNLNGSRSPSLQKQKADVISIPKEIFDLYDDLKKNYSLSSSSQADKLPSLIALIPSQKQSYCCRGFFLDDPTLSSKKTPHIMVLIEKVSQQRQFNFKELKERYGLTERQMDILKLLVNGSSNKEIADVLCVTEDTVKGHLKHVMRRLKVSTRTEILSMLFQL